MKEFLDYERAAQAAYPKAWAASRRKADRARLLDEVRPIVDAAVPDILALLREWGGEEVWWCEEHDAPKCRHAFAGGHCTAQHPLDGDDVGACRITEQIRVPLDVLAADTGSET